MIFLPGVCLAENQSAEISNGDVKIGVLTDMSGVYKNVAGPGVKIAAEMAIEDFGGTVLGKPIKLISADHQNKPDVGSSIARRWIDSDKVDMIAGLADSAVALAVQKLASEKDVITMAAGAGSSDLTEKGCTRFGIHYVFDTYSLTVGTAKAIYNGGGHSWFFITADYAFGHSLQDNATKVIEKLGGKVVGSADAPLGTTDFMSYIIQAKNSGADVIALANAGGDTVNAIKQAHELRITDDGQKLAGLMVFLTTTKALGLEIAQGLEYNTGFYWNRTPESHKWSERFFKRHGAMPTMAQAGVYSATLTYLKAVKKAHTDEASAVRKVLGEMKIHDMFTDNGYIRPNGRMVHDMYLVRVKSPSQSSGPWDLAEVIKTIPGDEAFIPLDKSTCPLLHKKS